MSTIYDLRYHMAYDFWQLMRGSLQLRYYTFSESICYTFGYAQRIECIQKITRGLSASICRRPTGGGLIRHEKDWIYALVFPATLSCSHWLPSKIYHALHTALRETFSAFALKTELYPHDIASKEQKEVCQVCFTQPAPFDLYLVEDPKRPKLAGAALKRTKQGMLVQGAIDIRSVKNLLPAADCFFALFAHHLAQPLFLGEAVPISGTQDLTLLKDFAELYARLKSIQWLYKR